MSIVQMRKQGSILRRGCLCNLFALLFLSHLRDDILATFPFTSDQKATFERNAAMTLAKPESDLLQTSLTAQKLLASLHNAHCQFLEIPGLERYFPLGYSVTSQGDHLYLQQDAHTLGALRTIDGVAAHTRITDLLERISWSREAFGRAKALQRFLGSHEPADATIELENGQTLRLPRTLRPSIRKSPRIEIAAGEISLTIPSWTGRNCSLADIEDIVVQVAAHPELPVILDLRGNQGGNSTLADALLGHFFAQDVPTGRRHKREGNTFITVQGTCKALLPHLPNPLTVLVDELCLSTTEYVAATLQDTGRARIRGVTTGGSSGNPVTREVMLSGQRCVYTIPTWLFERQNGQILEGIGVTPDESF